MDYTERSIMSLLLVPSGGHEKGIWCRWMCVFVEHKMHVLLLGYADDYHMFGGSAERLMAGFKVPSVAG